NTRIRFTVNGNGGVLGIVAAGGAGYVDNVLITYAKNASGTDGPFSAATDTASITVTPVNDAPAGPNTTVTPLEDPDYTFTGVDLDPTPRTMTINVTSVNDAPAGTNKTVTTLEDAAYTFTAADFGFTDPNDSPANAFTNVKITTVPTAGSLKLNGIAVTANQV